MRTWTDELPPVTVVVPSAGSPRFILFETSLELLHVPVGSAHFRVVGARLCSNLNEAIRRSTTDWFWFIDDDHHFEPWILIRLLSHQVPIVTALTCLSKPPFSPVIYKQEVEIQQKNGQPGYLYLNYSWADLDGRSGLLGLNGEVVATGRAGMLVSRKVLEDVGDPWFEYGQTATEEPGEDLWFCRKARLKGYNLVVDLDMFHGHLAACAAWPYRKPDGSWCIRLDWGTGEPGIIINRKDREALKTTVGLSKPVDFYVTLKKEEEA